LKKSKNIASITIVGGGSAGWMTASILSKYFSDKNITVIESKDVPIVGVGESTLGGINWFFNALGIKDEDFMKDCDASYKMSIKFTDFYRKNYGSFHYPFGNVNVEGTGWNIWDWQLVKYFYPDTPIEDYARSYFPATHLFEKNKISENLKNEFDGFRFDTDVAYHFDAVKLGGWLKEKYAKPNGVKHIIGTVKEVKLNEDGVEKLVLEDGSEIFSDLFIDCTGFKSLLLGETLKEPFISKHDILQNNRAWAAQVPYKEKEKELEPFTNSTAIENGWCWNIPLWSRLGTGYVYSDKHVEPEVAKEEFKKYLMSDKMVVPRTREEVDSLTFKDIKMRVGIHERIWVKNVAAIGLSAGFIEPLESNGLFSVHEFLFKLVRVLDLEYVNQFDIDMYNNACRIMFENFSEFVSMHYALSKRDDTEYWKDIQKRSFSNKMTDNSLHRSTAYYEFQDTFMFKNEHNNLHAGIHCIATGLNYPMVNDHIINDKSFVFKEQDFSELVKLLKANLTKNKARWSKASENAVSLYEFLKQKIYK
jgi:hypothetical protein